MKNETGVGPCEECGEQPTLKKLVNHHYPTETTEYAVGCACWDRYLYFTDDRIETFIPETWTFE